MLHFLLWVDLTSKCNIGSTISLDGENSGNISASGNLAVDGEIHFNHGELTSPPCNNTTGCILKIVNGKVQTTNNVNPRLGSADEQTSVFRL